MTAVSALCALCLLCCLFFFNDTATTEIYTLSLHDALPILNKRCPSLPSPDRIAAGPTDRLLPIYVAQLLHSGRNPGVLRAGLSRHVVGAFEFPAGPAGQRISVAHGGHVSAPRRPWRGAHQCHEPSFRAGRPAQRTGPAG